MITFRGLTAEKAYDKLKELHLDGGEARRYIRLADRLGSFNCGPVRGKRVVIRKKDDTYQVDVYG